MKNGLFKKSMSVFLAILMLMSAWVWVAPTEAEAIASNVRGVPAIRGSHYAGSTGAYGTPLFDGNLDRWFKFHNKGSDYVQIYYPSNIYLDKSETLQSAGYFFNVNWAFGNSSDYRILIGANALGDNSQWGGYPSKYYTMTNCFNNYGFDASTPTGGRKIVYNNSTGGTDYDLRIVGYGHSTQGSDGFSYDGTRHDRYVLFRSYSGNPNTATIYLMGNPNGTYDRAEYNTTGSSLGSYGFQQNYNSDWKENNNSMFKQKSYDAANDGCSSYYEGQYAEMQWFVTVYDKSALNSLITTAESTYKDSSKYTSASWSKYQTALNNAKTKLKTRAIQQGASDSTDGNTINGAKNNLQSAINDLVRINTITYNTAGGTIVGSGYTSIFTKNDNLILPEATRTGYTFGGWKVTEADGTLVGEKGKVYSAANYGTNVDGNATLVAQWTEHKYNIAFNANGGSGSTAGINNVLYSADTKLTANAFSRTGYTFTGWNTKADGSGNAYADQVTVSKLSANDGATVTLYAQWTANKYTVTWKNDDGTVLKTDTVEYGTTPSYNGATPTKTATDQYTYTFDGWDSALAPVTGDVTYTAKYKSTVNNYTVTWVDGDGKTIKTEQVAYGETPSYTGDTPTKTATAQYSYTFKGWSPELATVTGPATYTAQFDSTVNKYTVTWVNYDGTVLETDENVAYGTTPEYNGATPAKLGTAQYNYFFTTWDPAVGPVEGNVTYKAQFRESLTRHTVRFLNYDGTELQRSTLEYGSTPIYNGATPTKPADAQYTYTFAGWDKEIKDVTVSVDYKATFSTTVNEYTVTWVDGDGKTLKTEQVAYGATPAYTGDTPTKTATKQYTYTFNNTWTPAIATVTGNATYTAQFDSTVNSYTVTWKNHDGTILETDTVEYGDMPSYDGAAPTKAGNAQYSYAFAGWDNEIATVTGDVTYTATYTESTNSYTVIWANEDGTVLEKDENVLYGSVPSYDGATPTKAATAQYTYTYKSWDKAISEVTGDVTYTAVYDSVVNEYTITFKNENGDVLQSGPVEYGETPEYSGATPTKTATAQYTYTFDKWSPAIESVTGEATYTATYTATVNKYTVKFVNEDGTELQSSEVAYGATPAYTGETPTKAADAQYTYTFAGWTPAISEVTGVATYTATYTATVNKYTVKFVDEDGTELQSSEVAYGATPAYTGETPTKAQTAECSYTFDKWSPAIAAVTGDATYTATYKATKRSYEVTFVDEDGTVLQSSEVAYGETPAYVGENPVKASTAQYDYTFAGWDPEINEVTGEATYKATYTETVRKYNVTWVDGNGETLKTEQVAYGETPDYTGDTPTKTATAQYSYTFKGWSPAITAVTGDTTYTAQFDSTVNEYTITWKNDDGSVIDTTTVAYGVVPTHADATKAATAQYTYTFAGWDPEVVAVTGDATYTATYTATKNSYTITWLNDDDSVIDTTTVEYGETPAYTGETPTKAATDEYTYTFAGWTPEVVAVTGEATYKATFTATKRSYTITWLNDDNSVIDTTTVEYGVVPTHADATKAATAQYTYTFAGWTPEVVAVTGDATYTATYTSTVNKYTIKFVNEDGTELQSSEVEYGETPAYTGETPTKAADSQSVYAFDGWTPEVVAVTGDATYTAKYSSVANEYEIMFKNINGEIVKSEKVAYGDKPVAPENSAIKYDENGHHSYAWPELEKVTSEFTYIEVETIVGHTPAVAVEENKTDSTCYKTGSYDEVVYCSLDECQFEISRTEKTIELKEHTPGEAVIENEIKATCTTDGSYDKVVYCSVEECKQVISKDTVTILALNHKNKVHHEKVEATCAETGTIEYWSCPDCSKNFSDADCTAEVTDITIAKNAENHVEIKKVEAKEPSCTEVGYDAYEYCTGCTYTTYTEIPQKGHTPVPGEYKAPTCISEGYEGATICDVCKVEITAGKYIDKLAHEFGNTPVQVIPENCTYEATYVYKCKFCTETNKVGGEAKPEGDKGPHTIVELEKIEPTCDTAGIYSYYCSTCGSTVKTETIDPIGHADKDGDGYCDNCGGKYFDPNNQSVCTCLCHKESGFMKFLYKIANFFWKLFKINKSCACGYVHY